MASKAGSFLQYNETRMLFGATIVAILISAWGAFDMKIWILEAGPVLVALPLLVRRYRRHRLTPLLYRLLFFGSLLLLTGAHYTYARVPLGFWLKNAFNLQRNHYDRIGHFFQGFVPAILAREILLRRGIVKRSVWLSGIVVCICLAFSAYYEIVEWWTASLGGDQTGDFLGTQGDIYDAQWDMLMALVGSIVALLFLGDEHDREVDELERRTKKLEASRKQ